MYVISTRSGLSMHKLRCSTKVSQQFLIDGCLHVHVWRRSCPLILEWLHRLITCNRSTRVHVPKVSHTPIIHVHNHQNENIIHVHV